MSIDVIIQVFSEAVMFCLTVLILLSSRVNFSHRPINFKRQQTAFSNTELNESKNKIKFSKHRCKPQWVINWVIHARAYSPNKGCRTIANEFNLAHAGRGMSVSKSFVHKTLRKHAYAVADLRRRWRNKLPHPCVRNAVWAMDLTGKQIVGRGAVEADVTAQLRSKSKNAVLKSKHAIETAHILGIIDHGSRYALCLRVLPSKHSWRLVLCLMEAVVRFGKPIAVRTDNESVFTGVVFRAVLAALGIKHQRTALASPWQNGRIERLFGTLKRELDLKTVSSAGALSHLIESFATFYNDVRPHQHLNGLTPALAWAELGWTDLRQTPPKSVERFNAWGGQITGFRLRL